MPLYRFLADRYGVEVLLHAGSDWGPKLDRPPPIAELPFPVREIEHQWQAFGVPRGRPAVISTINGRIALPATYLGARRAGVPFILWNSLWAHPRTAFHRLSEPLLSRIYAHAAAIVTYGPHASDHVLRHRADAGTVFVAAQAVENDIFSRPVSGEEVAAMRARLGAAGDEPLILFAGRLERQKGLPELVEAFARVRAEQPATLALVGEGPLRGDLAGRPGVVLAGALPRSELPAAYAAAAFLVLPCVRTAAVLETWGLVCNEAMCQARPVLATDAVGAAAGGLVTDGETGLVVPGGDVAALTAALSRLVGEPQLRERLGQAAAERVAGYTYERMADGFGRALAAVGAANGPRAG